MRMVLVMTRLHLPSVARAYLIQFMERLFNLRIFLILVPTLGAQSCMQNALSVALPVLIVSDEHEHDAVKRFGLCSAIVQ